jgi:hypothetical protein
MQHAKISAYLVHGPPHSHTLVYTTKSPNVYFDRRREIRRNCACICFTAAEVVNRVDRHAARARRGMQTIEPRKFAATRHTATISVQLNIQRRDVYHQKPTLHTTTRNLLRPRKISNCRGRADGNYTQHTQHSMPVSICTTVHRRAGFYNEYCIRQYRISIQHGMHTSTAH